jgi:hypothetical protein
MVRGFLWFWGLRWIVGSAFRCLVSGGFGVAAVLGRQVRELFGHVCFDWVPSVGICGVGRPDLQWTGGWWRKCVRLGDSVFQFVKFRRTLKIDKPGCLLCSCLQVEVFVRPASNQTRQTHNNMVSAKRVVPRAWLAMITCGSRSLIAGWGGGDLLRCDGPVRVSERMGNWIRRARGQGSLREGMIVVASASVFGPGREGHRLADHLWVNDWTKRSGCGCGNGCRFKLCWKGVRKGADKRGPIRLSLRLLIRCHQALCCIPSATSAAATVTRAFFVEKDGGTDCSVSTLCSWLYYGTLKACRRPSLPSTRRGPTVHRVSLGGVGGFLGSTHLVGCRRGTCALSDQVVTC